MGEVLRTADGAWTPAGMKALRWALGQRAGSRYVGSAPRPRPRRPLRQARCAALIGVGERSWQYWERGEQPIPRRVSAALDSVALQSLDNAQAFGLKSVSEVEASAKVWQQFAEHYASEAYRVHEVLRKAQASVQGVAVRRPVLIADGSGPDDPGAVFRERP